MPRASVYSDPTWKFEAPAETPEEQIIGMVKNAVDCLGSGAEPETSAAKALRAVEPLFALYESARTHGRIMLPLTGVTGNPLHEMLAAHAEKGITA